MGEIVKADILGDRIVFLPATGAEELGIKSFLNSLVTNNTITNGDMNKNFSVNINIVKDLELCLDD